MAWNTEMGIVNEQYANVAGEVSSDRVCVHEICRNIDDRHTHIHMHATCTSVHTHSHTHIHTVHTQYTDNGHTQYTDNGHTDLIYSYELVPPEIIVILHGQFHVSLCHLLFLQP